MRIVMTAVLIAALSGAAYAADDSLDKAAKKTSDGFGNLLNAMGQEIKKIGDEEKKAEKKDEKKDDKKSAAKADPNPKSDRQY
jgi:hypothetical protein